MTRQALPHEVRELTDRLPRWMPAFLSWSIQFDRLGWPLVRRVPLHTAAFVVKLYARGYL